VFSGALVHSQQACAEGASVTHANRLQIAKASRIYRRALKAFDAKKFEEALELLRESFNIVASPNSQLVIAHTLVQLGRELDAYRELEAAMKLARELSKVDKKYEKTVESAQKELDELSRKLALVVVKPSTEVTLGDQKIAHSDWGRPLPVLPGKLQVVVKHEGGEEVTQELELAAGNETEISTAPPPPPPPPAVAKPPPVVAPSPHPKPEPDTVHKRTLAYITGAVGLVGVGTFATFIALDSSSDDELSCTAGVCPQATVDSAATNSSYQTLAFVGLGVGLVSLATSGYLFVTSDSDEPSDKPTTGLAVGPGSVMVRGSF
jgi:hypothetical protein